MAFLENSIVLSFLIDPSSCLLRDHVFIISLNEDKDIICCAHCYIPGSWQNEWQELQLHQAAIEWLETDFHVTPPTVHARRTARAVQRIKGTLALLILSRNTAKEWNGRMPPGETKRGLP